MFKKILYLFILLIGIPFNLNATELKISAYKKSYNKLSNKNKIIIDKVNDYLLNINALYSDFIQFNEMEETSSEGKFFLQRPNKLRFEYINPFKMLLITNNSVTTFYDIELEEIGRAHV